MSRPQPDIASLLGSRICHDLISPLGAISNGVELLTMTGDAVGPEIALIAESIENANARIRFFRVAYGAAGEDQTMSAREIRSILSDLAKSSRLQIVWSHDGDTPRPQTKLAFLILQCLETALPWGGKIEVSQQNGRWSVIGTAERTKINPDLWEVLSRSDATAGVKAAEVQFLMVPPLMQAAGRTLSLEMSDTQIAARY